MAQVLATATIRETRRYTLTIYDDGGGTALNERVDVGIADGITWGDLQREARPGILPSQMNLTIYDPPAALEARITGYSTPQELPVIVERDDRNWQWRGYIRPRPQIRALNKRLGVPELTLEVTDGLDLLKDAPGTFASLDSIGGAFYYANADLKAFHYLATDHAAGQSTDAKNDDVRLSDILIPDRLAKEWRTWGDLMEEVCQRYNAIAFLEPTDVVDLTTDILGRGPRWHIEFLGTLGLSVTGRSRTTGTTGFSGAGDLVSISRDVVSVSLSDLSTDSIRPLQSAVTRRIDSAVPEAEANDPPALVLSAENAFRDGFFQYQTTGGEPLYAESILGNVGVIANRITIEQDAGQNGEFVSEFFRVDAPAVALLTYDAEFVTGTDLTVILRLNRDSGGVDSVSGGTGLSATLQLAIATPGELQVVANADDAEFGEATLEIYRVDTLANTDYIERIEFPSPGNAYLVREIDALIDLDLLNVADYDDAGSASGRSVAPCSRYTHDHLNVSARTATEYSAEVLRLLRVAGTETLLASYMPSARTCLSPRTRLEVDVDGETVPLVIGGGRRADLLRGITDLADISTPIDAL